VQKKENPKKTNMAMIDSGYVKDIPHF